MTTATLPLSGALSGPSHTARKGLLARFYAALMEARMRHAIREIAMHRHLLPEELVKDTGYRATVANDGALPFTRAT